ncbi:MAG TPA: HAD-IA family hydrolase [Caulobacteraceae bacterium]|nr:HAD-IA family hydrolase [Caulobacteraceae bacterium]
MTTPAAVLFDLGGVLLPFDRERRVAAIVQQLGVEADDVRELFDGPLPRQMDHGHADETDFAAAFADLAGRPIAPATARALLLSVFEPPNVGLWRLAAELRRRVIVGGFSDNPAFVAEMFPDGALLDPMIFSAEIGAAKPSDAAFAAAEARLGLGGDRVLFIDDGLANVQAARRRGWDAILFTDNAALVAEIAARGLP